MQEFPCRRPDASLISALLFDWLLHALPTLCFQGFPLWIGTRASKASAANGASPLLESDFRHLRTLPPERGGSEILCLQAPPPGFLQVLKIKDLDIL